MYNYPGRRTWLVVLLFVLFAPRLFGQVEVDRPRVLVLPFANQTPQEQNGVIARTTAETIALTLRLLNSYELLAPAGLTSEEILEMTPAELSEVATTVGADNIIFGSVSTAEAGGFLFSLKVYDRGEGGISLQATSRAESLFDVFQASDELVAEAVSGFSGIRIGFGSISLRAEGEGQFNLYIDGSLVGKDLYTVDQVLIGERTVEIRQIRGEREVSIYRSVVDITEDERSTVSFSFPAVTEKELALDERLREEIRMELVSGVDPAGIEARLQELGMLYERLPGALPASAEDVRFLEDRLYLAEELQRLPELDLAALAGLDRSEQQDRITEIVTPWIAVYERQERYGGQSGLYPLEYRQERVETDIERNTGLLQSLITLERIAVTEREQYELVDGYNRLWRVVQSQEFNGPSYLIWGRQNFQAESYVRDYRRALERRRPVWHWIVGGLGVGGIGYAAYTQFVGDLPEIRDRVETNIDRYEESTDVNEINDLQEQITEDKEQYNTLQTFVIAGASGGTVLLSTAIIGRVVSLTRPRRIWRRYRNQEFVDRWTATGLDYTNRPDPDSGQAAVVVFGTSDTFRATGVNGLLNTPQYLEVDTGEPFVLTHENASTRQRERYSFTPRPGVTVINLGGINDDGPEQ